MLKTGKINLFIFIFFIFFLCNLVLAADVTFNATVDKNSVALDDTVQYTLSVSGQSGNVPRPDLPQFSNLSVVSQGQSSNFSFVNGKMSSSISFTYILQPGKTGPAHIGPASININGQTYTTESIDIKVTKAEGKMSQSGPQVGRRPGIPNIWDDFDEIFKSPFSSRFSRPQVIKDPLKVELKASQNTVYVNQQILLTFTLYTRVNFVQSPQYAPPDTTGFLVVNLPIDKKLREVTLNGITYMAQDFKTALFPTTAGNFTIGPATLIAQIDRFNSPQEVKTNPLKIKVLPLPHNGKPANFSGAVGDYRLDVTMKQNEIERGQPIQITAKVTGKGNIQTISEPVNSFPEEFKKLSSTGKEDLIKGQSGVSGSKSFEIVLIPLKEGKFTLPPFEFVFFDPAKKEYRTLKSRAFPVNILPSQTPLPQEYEQSLAETSTKKQPTPITVDWQKIGTAVFTIVASPYFWLPSLIIFVLIIIFVFYRKYREKLVSDPVKLRQKQALNVARKRLKKSFHLLKKNALKEFLGEIFNATAKYLGDKYGFPATGITTDGLRKILSNKGLSQEAQTQLESFILECDLLRFTPSSLSRGKAVELAQKAEKLIVMIEKIS